MTPDCCADCAAADFSDFLVRLRNSSNCHSGHSKQSASALEKNRQLHLLQNFFDISHYSISDRKACKYTQYIHNGASSQL